MAVKNNKITKPTSYLPEKIPLLKILTVKKCFLMWLPKEKEIRLIQSCFLFLSVSLGIFFLTVLSPFTVLVEINKKGKRSLGITGFITIISPAEKRLMRLSSYWNPHFNKHQQSTWAGHREWPSIRKSFAWYLLNSHVQSKKLFLIWETSHHYFCCSLNYSVCLKNGNYVKQIVCF